MERNFPRNLHQIAFRRLEKNRTELKLKDNENRNFASHC